MVRGNQPDYCKKCAFLAFYQEWLRSIDINYNATQNCHKAAGGPTLQINRIVLLRT
jgi:hypothetical protein